MKIVSSTKQILLFSLVFGLLSVFASAQSWREFSSKRFFATGFAGVSSYDLSDEIEPSGVEVDEEVVFGGRFEFRLTPHIGLEGSVGFSPAAVSFLGAGTESDVDSWDIHGNVVYHLAPDARIDPFVTGGIGARVLDFSGGDTESFLAGNFGGGLLIPINSHLAIRGETRFYVYNLDDLDSTSTGFAALQTFDETVWDVQVTGGVTIAF